MFYWRSHTGRKNRFTGANHRTALWYTAKVTSKCDNFKVQRLVNALNILRNIYTRIFICATSRTIKKKHLITSQLYPLQSRQ